MSDILTVLDVEKISFSKAMRGYNTEEVEEFLEKVAGSLQIYSEKIKTLEVQLSRFDEQVREYTELKQSLQEALVLAQKSAEERVSSAESKAEVIIARLKPGPQDRHRCQGQGGCPQAGYREAQADQVPVRSRIQGTSCQIRIYAEIAGGSCR